MRDLQKFLICLNQNLILLHLNLKVEEKKSLATLPPISPSEQQFVGVESPDAPPTKKRRKTIYRKYESDVQRLLLYGGPKIHIQVVVVKFELDLIQTIDFIYH